MTAEERLDLIAEHHARSNADDEACSECENPWPCPTYLVATLENFPGRDPFQIRDAEELARLGELT